VCGDETARQIYVAYMQELASLRWSYASHPLDLINQLVREASSSPDRLADSLVQLADRGRSRIGIPLRWAAGVAAVLLTALFTAWWTADRGGHYVGQATPAQVEPSGGSGHLVGEESGEAPFSSRPIQEPVAGTAVATITRVIDATWGRGMLPLLELSRLRTGQMVNLEAGQVELLFDTGVEVILKGQTHFEIRSADRAYSRRGSISARVGDEARGFTIETPSARVIDLGTEFGVSISEVGEMEVAVFRGIVDLALDSSTKNSAGVVSKRLNQGEALRVGRNGEFHRVFAIASDHFPSAAAIHVPHRGRIPLITDVRDNIRDPESQKFYKIVRSGLHEDAPAFVDRVHQWNGVDGRGIPAQLLGAEYVMPFNDDKQFTSRLEVTLHVARPASLYVFLSDAIDVPVWLKADFVDTGENIGLDEGPSRWFPAETGRRKLGAGTGQSVDTIFSIWKRDILDPSQVVVGGVDRPARLPGYNMYGIAAVPLD